MIGMISYILKKKFKKIKLKKNHDRVTNAAE